MGEVSVGAIVGNENNHQVGRSRNSGVRARLRINLTKSSAIRTDA